jgi:hypothetical protein
MARFALVSLAIAARGCNAFESVQPPPMEVLIRVESDPGKPLKNATLMFNGQKVGTTGDDGGGRIKLNGKDGDSFDINVTCPEGYQTP